MSFITRLAPFTLMPMQTNRVRRVGSAILLIGVILLLSIGGCAHHRRKQAEEARQQEAAMKPLPNAPVMVYVAPIDLGTTMPDTSGAGPTSLPTTPAGHGAQETTRLATLLRERIIFNLHESHLPAQAIDDFSSPLRSGWLVTARLFEVSPDGRLIPIALDAQSATANTWLLVNLRDLSRRSGQNMINFDIDAKGNATTRPARPPGTSGAAEFAGRFVLSTNADESDVRRLGYQIANQIVALAGHEEK